MAIDVHRSFVSVSDSESRACCAQTPVRVCVGWRAISNNQLSAWCNWCEKTHPLASCLVAHTLPNVASCLGGGEGAVILQSGTKSGKGFCF